MARALGQTYTSIEIVVCDNSPSDQIRSIIAGHRYPRLCCYRNPVRLGSRANDLHCFERAQGEFINFLNDDDILEPTCVERMLAVLWARPEVTLVTSRRQCIDAESRVLPPVPAMRHRVERDTNLDGRTTVETMLTEGCNLVGEPTTALFRKRDANALPDFMSFGGVRATWCVDMTIWAYLRSKGDLAFLAKPPSRFRLHANQEQQQPGDRARGGPALEQLRRPWQAHSGPPAVTSPRGAR